MRFDPVMDRCPATGARSAAWGIGGDDFRMNECGGQDDHPPLFCFLAELFEARERFGGFRFCLGIGGFFGGGFGFHFRDGGG